MGGAINHSIISAHFLLSAYYNFLSTQTYKYMRLITFYSIIIVCTCIAHPQVGIQTRTVADLTAVANFVRNNNVPLLFVALLLLQFLSMVVDRLVSEMLRSYKIVVELKL